MTSSEMVKYTRDVLWDSPKAWREKHTTKWPDVCLKIRSKTSNLSGWCFFWPPILTNICSPKMLFPEVSNGENYIKIFETHRLAEVLMSTLCSFQLLPCDYEDSGLPIPPHFVGKYTIPGEHYRSPNILSQGRLFLSTTLHDENSAKMRKRRRCHQWREPPHWWEETVEIGAIIRIDQP